MPSFKNNIKQLKSLIEHAPVANKSKIKKVISLYEEKKIPNFKTALNLSIKLFSPSLYKKEDVDKSYNEIINKYKEAEPITGRLKREIESKRPKKYECKVLLYRDVPVGTETDKPMEHNGLSHKDNEKYKKYMRKRYKGYHQYFSGHLNILVSDSNVKLLSNNINKFVKRMSTDPKHDLGNPVFLDINNIFMTDDEFKDRVKHDHEYITALYILELRSYDNVEPVNPAKVPKRAGNKSNICYKYCSTSLDLTKNTFRQALEKKNYRRNECWLNTLYDHYHDTLLNPNRSQRYVVTREKILNIINRTEETIKDGLTIDDILPFFPTF